MQRQSCLPVGENSRTSCTRQQLPGCVEWVKQLAKIPNQQSGRSPPDTVNCWRLLKKGAASETASQPASEELLQIFRLKPSGANLTLGAPCLNGGFVPVSGHSRDRQRAPGFDP